MYLSGPDGPFTGTLPDPLPGGPIALTEEGEAFYERLRRVQEAREEARGLTSPDLATWYAPVVEEPMSGHNKLS